MGLTGKIIEQSALTDAQIQSMFVLMVEFYDNMVYEAFLNDLWDKDYCIVLYDENGVLVGFSTQKVLSLPIGEKTIHGVFSGDTIIHKDHWGSPMLFQIFARFFFDYAKRYDEFYWFLIVKGYKTYKILPTFFNDFYPNYAKETPPYEKSIMDAYAAALFKDDYDKKTGVVAYKKSKDRLKLGVADIDPRIRKDKNAAFFEAANPDYINGHDLVCLTELKHTNLRPSANRALFGL